MPDRTGGPVTITCPVRVRRIFDHKQLTFLRNRHDGAHVGGLAGAFGHTYGHNSIWQMYAPPRKPILDAKLTWREALDAPSAKQMGYLRKVIELRPFLTQTPDQSLIAGDVGYGDAHIRALRGDGYALIYTPTGRKLEIQLGKLSGEKVKASWFNPRTGESVVIGELENHGRHRFDPPGEAPPGGDWILALDSPATAEQLLR